MKEYRQWLATYIIRNGDSKTKLARAIGYSTSQIDKWVSGENKIPFDAIEPLSKKLRLNHEEQLEIYRLAGYRLPYWLVPMDTQAVHGGMGLEEFEVIRFGTMAHLFAFVKQEIDEAAAEGEICDLTWGPGVATRSGAEDAAYQGYLESIRRACDRDIRYREVMTFYESHSHYISRARSFLEEGKISYNLRYYELPSNPIERPPLMSFIIINNRILVCGLYSPPERSPDKEIRLAIRHPNIIMMFQDYFDVIWQQAARLKDGDETFWLTFQKLEARFGASEALG